ncbi:helix-turn-helix transcriptional regulator [Marinilactibacillus psychrotolerans]|uniref:Helix-turn-helix transcriptional regulator n=1 Tax=Marinilactibacillus psychrotolerans TaxID=191770 RepID=A0ABW8UJC1_9LACT
MENFITEKQKIIDVIEDNLMAFDLSEIESLTGVPLSLYQRFFSYMYGISIPAYIRKRKLTLSASKLLLGEWSVMTASLECGYEDSSSFSRAFKKLFQVAPSEITIKKFEEFQVKKIDLTNLSNQNTKANLVSVDYPVIHEQYLLGISTKRYPAKVGSSLWEVFRSDSVFEKFSAMESNLNNKNDDYIAVAYMSDFSDSDSLGQEYMIGRLYDKIPPDLGDLEIKKLDCMQLVHSKIKGRTIDDIIAGAYAITCDIANKNGYNIDYQSFFWLEYYSDEQFGEMYAQHEELILDFYMPCKKIKERSGGIK